MEVKGLSTVSLEWHCKTVWCKSI